MYVILVYDVGVDRVARALKLCRRYLNWVQNSVFEGEISESRLQRLSEAMRKLMDVSCDSTIIYVLRDERWMDRRIIGQDKGQSSNLVE